MLFIHILRQAVDLLVVGVRELAAQIVLLVRFLAVLLVVLKLVLDGKLKVAVLVELNADVVFLDARNGYFHGVFIRVFLHVHCRGSSVHATNTVQEIITEIVVKPIVQYWE